MHLTRDCRGVSEVWLRLTENRLRPDFFNDDIHVWMINNLKCNTLIHGVEWKIIFGAATSVLWLNRNKKAFNDKVDSVKVLCCKVIHQAMAFHQSTIDFVETVQQVTRVNHSNIHWMPPPCDVCKLNCDGAMSGLGTNSVVGGVLRDHYDNFIFGFASALKSCNVLEAELHALSMGINLARLKGFWKVEIESDSLSVVRFIKEGCSSRHPLFNLISDIQDHLAWRMICI